MNNNVITDKIKLRYDKLLQKYGETIGKKEYSKIFGLSISTIDKYLANGGINLVPYKKHEPLKYGNNEKKNKCKIYWDVLDVAIELEKSVKVA